jgi:hypothetical protein
MMAVGVGEYVGKLERRLEVGTRRWHPTAEWPTTLKITASQVMIAVQQVRAARRGLRSRPGESSDARHPVATDLPAWEIQAHRPWRPTRTSRPSRRPRAGAEAAVRKGHITNHSRQDMVFD